MNYTVRLPFIVSITAGNEEDGNEELAQKRGEQVEEWVTKAAVTELAKHKAAWLGYLESEGMEVEQA